MKKSLSVLLAAALLLSLLSACGGGAEKAAGGTHSFTDSCGRTVDVPDDVEKIVPSGSLAQMILYTVCPDKLQSLSAAPTKRQEKYFGAAYSALPVTGQFYGGGSTVNYEEIIAAAPDLIVDIGEEKEGIADDMDMLQQRTGIPTVFIQASLATMADAYETLGELTGETEQAQACADYIRQTLAYAAEKSASIPDSEKKRVLYAQGEYGTEVLAAGSIHAELLDIVGAVNAAVLDDVSSDGANEVSMEQILRWDPEVVILAPDSDYDDIFADKSWAGVRAVRDGEVYEAPEAPYNWMDRPPSVQRVLAVKWLGNLLYPDVYDCDMIAEAQAFYKLFWHYDLSEDEARELMRHSTFKD